MCEWSLQWNGRCEDKTDQWEVRESNGRNRGAFRVYMGVEDEKMNKPRENERNNGRGEVIMR